MKKRLWIVVVLVAWLPLFMGVWDKAKPAASTTLKASNPELLANNTALETAIDADHDFTTSGTQTGRHEAIHLLEQADLGTGATGVPLLGAQTTDSAPELVFTDESDNDVVLTSKGNRLANDTYFTATDNAGTGSVNLFKADVNDCLYIPIDALLVGDVNMVSGKVLEVETLEAVDGTGILLNNQYGNTGLTIVDDVNEEAYVTLADNSQLATNAAPEDDEDIPNKKYVDDQAAAVDSADDMTPTAYVGGESITFANGLILKHGADTADGNGDGTVTFSTAFPNNAISITFSSNQSMTGAYVSAFSRTAFSYNTGGTTNTVYWQVWGY